MFKELIGWKLHYIAYKPRVQIKGTNLNGKSCQHVTIWISDPPDQQPKILFCYEDERGGYFWISGGESRVARCMGSKKERPNNY